MSREQERTVAFGLCVLLAAGAHAPGAGRETAMKRAEAVHVWERIEVTLTARRAHEDPYRDVEVWAEWTGPSGDSKRCYGFWDGGKTFRIRLVATEPGTWTYRTACNSGDPGLTGKTGRFTAAAWTAAEKRANPCRRGFLRPTPNGHALRYADGEPCFLLGDTWWPVGTFRYRWDNGDGGRGVGPEMGLKDAVRFRKRQGFNCIAMIAAFPSWANDGLPTEVREADGTVLRHAWGQAGTKSAKDMHDEEGNRPFLFPGKAKGFEKVLPDLDRINPAYFRNLDRKIDYLNAQGFIPFIEAARRDIGQAWKKHHAWPDSYARYVQYLWARCQGSNCILSPIHFDWNARTIAKADWNAAATRVIERWGRPPFGQPVSTNIDGSTLRSWGHVDKAPWLTLHQTGNQREHGYYAYLTEIFAADPPLPALNGEPYYDGWGRAARAGTQKSALYCRSGMYGSVLSGGLAGHIHGAEGLWPGNVEPAARYKIWEALSWPGGSQMRHLATFVLSEGTRYQHLVPHRELLKPNATGPAKGYSGWAYCARTEEKDLFLLYFEQGCPRGRLSGAAAGGTYAAQWFNPRTGQWTKAAGSPLETTRGGAIALPRFPGGKDRSGNDWAMKLKADPPLRGQ